MWYIYIHIMYGILSRHIISIYRLTQFPRNIKIHLRFFPHFNSTSPRFGAFLTVQKKNILSAPNVGFVHATKTVDEFHAAGTWKQVRNLRRSKWKNLQPFWWVSPANKKTSCFADKNTLKTTPNSWTPELQQFKEMVKNVSVESLSGFSAEQKPME